jgi:ATP-dependent Clp protease ATP-binding subunit ClpC
MATRMCDVCGIRPAVVTVRRIIPGEGERVEHLCEIHASEAGVLGGSAFEGSSLGGGRLGRGSLFDDFFGRFFDDEPFGTTRGGGGMAPRRQTEQIDITQYFSDATTELLQRAAQQAVEWGNLDLTSEHLLYAALEDRVVRRRPGGYQGPARGRGREGRTHRRLAIARPRRQEGAARRLR